MKGTRWAALFAACMLLTTVGIAAAEDKKDEAKAAKAKGGDVSATLQANERAIWEAIKNHDGGAFLALVDKDGMGADMNGFSKASQRPDMMKDMDLRSYDLRDFNTMMVSKDAYVLTYTATVDASYKGRSMPPLPTFISTLYVKRGGKWLELYHQETMAMPPQAAGESH
jgi:hypothetical protein